jgi:hypothetical protein
MSRRRPTTSFEEWEAERVAADPHWGKRVREFSRTSGIPRKVPLLLDANLEVEFADELRGIRDFKVQTMANQSAGDPALWAEARKRGLVLVTADAGFWDDDHKYPIRDSPGLVVVSGRTYSEKAEAFAVAVIHWEIRWRYRIESSSLRGMKIKASRSGTSAKWWDGTRVITISTDRE